MMPLSILRQLISEGATDDQIRAMDTAWSTGPAAPRPVTPGLAIRRSSTVTTTPFGAIAAPIITTEPGPNVTRTTYRLTLRGRNVAGQLDKHRVTGNQRIVADYILSADHPVDSHELRANVLRDKLRIDGTNKAVESAVHQLRVRGIIVRADKPPQSVTIPGVPID